MPLVCTSRPSRGGIDEAEVTIKQYDIPYFAHQQLDPARFPAALGSPVGRPPYKVAPYGAKGDVNGAWEEEADEDNKELDEDFAPLPSMSSKVTKKSKNPYGPSHRKLRIVGGRPAIAKKVTADLDSDDELIVRMKNAKYLEKDIAERLAKEGRIKYHPKTIGTRWARIKRKLQDFQDEMLDGDVTDWHEGDDEVLQKAIEKADADIEKAKRDADAKKWRIVADQMKVMKPVVNFSQNACRDRFEALYSGTAKPTPESIPDPDEKVKYRIQSRREKEEKIKEDAEQRAAHTRREDNIDGNAWTSKMRQYY